MDGSRPGHRWKELDPAVPERTRELTEAIRTASDRAGRPSFRKLTARSAESGDLILSLSTLSRIFAPKPDAADQASLPSWPYYAAVLTLLDADPADYQAPHNAAQQEWRTRSGAPHPATTDPDSEPPAATTPSDASTADALADAATDHQTAADQAVTDPAPESAVRASAPPTEPGGHVLRPRWRRQATLVGGVVGVVLVVVVAVLVAVRLPDGSTGADARAKPARTSWPNHPDPKLDQTNPEVTGCAAMPGEETFYSHLYADWPHDTIQTAAMVTLHYSPHCRTVWAVLTDAVPGAVARVHRTSDNAEAHCVAGPDGSCGTLQISDINVVTHADAQSGTAYGRTRDF